MTEKNMNSVDSTNNRKLDLSMFHNINHTVMYVIVVDIDLHVSTMASFLTKLDSHLL